MFCKGIGICQRCLDQMRCRSVMPEDANRFACRSGNLICIAPNLLFSNLCTQLNEQNQHRNACKRNFFSFRRQTNAAVHNVEDQRNICQRGKVWTDMQNRSNTVPNDIIGQSGSTCHQQQKDTQHATGMRRVIHRTRQRQNGKVCGA